MRSAMRLLLLLMLAAASPVGHAALVVHGIRLTVDAGSVFTYAPRSGADPEVSTEDAAGNVYFGHFAVDSDVLAADGIGRPGDLAYLVIKIEDNVWGYNSALNNSFFGFRGPIPHDPFCTVSAACLGAPSPGFTVQGGRITDLTGGVYGFSDEPFIDFTYPTLGDPGNRFYAFGRFLDVTHAWRYLQGGGTLEIIRVNEPSTLLLFGVSLAGLGLAVRRKPSLNSL